MDCLCIEHIIWTSGVILSLGSNWMVTRGIFYVRRTVDLMKPAKVNRYIVYIFGKIINTFNLKLFENVLF